MCIFAIKAYTKNLSWRGTDRTIGDLMEKKQITIMKDIIAKTKEIEKDLPSKPESLIDAKIIWTYPSGEKACLIKQSNSIRIGIINNMRVRKSISLDDSLLDDDGLLFLPSHETWQKLLSRLPLFRDYIDSEASKHSRA